MLCKLLFISLMDSGEGKQYLDKNVGILYHILD